MKPQPNRKVVLHIGMPKTGTTTIQFFLANNAEALAANGCLYPSTGQLHHAHHPLAALLLDRRPGLGWVDSLVPAVDPALLQQLKREIRGSACSTVVISTELFSFMRDTRKAIESFSEYDLRILFFIRRQDYWLESLCRQEMKTGTYSQADPQEFIETRLWEADYLEYLERWGKYLDEAKLKVVLLDRRLASAPVQQRFLSACDIDWSDAYSINRDENTKLTQECLHFLINSPQKDRIDEFHAHVDEALERYSQKHPDPPEYGWLLSPEQRRGILERVHERNALLAKRFLDDEEAKLFLDIDVDTETPWVKYPGLTVEKAVEIGYSVMRMMDFWREKERRIG